MASTHNRCRLADWCNMRKQSRAGCKQQDTTSCSCPTSHDCLHIRLNGPWLCNACKLDCLLGMTSRILLECCMMMSAFWHFNHQAQLHCFDTALQDSAAPELVVSRPCCTATPGAWLQVAKEMWEFNADTRPGRLMFMCLSPYVNKSETSTLFDHARIILEKYVPDAVCVVAHGGGMNALYNPETRGSASSSKDYSSGRGETIWVEDAQASRHAVRHRSRARAAAFGRRPLREPMISKKVAKQASTAIQQFDERFSLKRPIIVIGYNVIGRCASIRSGGRVITHIIGGYQKARNKADLEQMALRGNGKTRQVCRHLLMPACHLCEPTV